MAASDFPPRVSQSVATIAASGTTSGEVDLLGTSLVGMSIPAAFTGTAISFTAALASGGTFQVVKDGAGNTLSITVAQGQNIGFSQDVIARLSAWRFIKVVSGSTEAAERAVTLLSRPV